jgi:hypothetical protein
VLQESWVPEAAGCATDEAQIPQPDSLIYYLRACRPASTSAKGTLRLVNISDTTLLFDIGTGPEPDRWFAPDETELAKATLVNLGLNSSYDTATGRLLLPSRFSALVEDDWQLTSVPVHTDEAHGRRVAHARAIADLADEFPYVTLGDIDNKAAKVAACVGESATSINDRQLTLEEAVESSKSCFEMTSYLKEQWQAERAAEMRAGTVPKVGLPAEPAELVHGLSKGVAPLESEWTTISRQIVKGLRVVAHHG